MSTFTKTLAPVSSTQETKAASAKGKSKFHSAWTEARRSKVENYLAFLQGALRLRDWTITVDWSAPCEKDALATVTPMEDSRHATVRLSREFLDLSDRNKTQTLVHEMVHCYFFEVDSLATSTVEALTTKQASKVYSVAHNGCIERSVDTVADAFTELLPGLSLD